MIRKLIFTVLVTIVFLSCAIADKGYHIGFQVHGLQDTVAYLAYHFGNRQYVQDTVRIDSRGNFEFKGEKALNRGMYMVVLPGQVYFEILVDNNQHFGVETTNDDFVNTMKFRNSPDNEIFYQYMRFIRAQNEVATPLRTELQDSSTPESRRAQIREQLSQTDLLVKEHQKQIISKNPDGLFGKILLAQQEPEMPEIPLKPDGLPDTELQYHHYKNSFWNNIDFSDDRLVRTPIFHAKLNQFFTRVVIQIPDSIIIEADKLLKMARQNHEVFKYAVFFITNTFERSQIMGMDAVFVHMVENYYMTGDADWVTQEQLKKITERAMALKPLLIGKIAPDISVLTRDRRTVNLHNVNAKYTVLYFWDSECGHCKRNTPILKDLYRNLKGKGVEIFAVNTEAEREKWIEYIDNNQLTWINVQDPTNRSGFREKYDIWSTPLIFLLDKDKRIIAKKITVEQTEEIITMELQRN